MKRLLLALLSLTLALPAHARCAASPTYPAAIKAVACDEKGREHLFIRGELTQAAQAEDIPEPGKAPIKGRQYFFYLHVPEGSCRKFPKGSVLKGFLSRPCCDANYAYCGGRRRVDFILHSGDDAPH